VRKYAIERQRADAVLHLSPQVDVMDTGCGWTPLMRVSAVSGNQKVALLLIEAGADVNVKDKDGKTPLMVRPSPAGLSFFYNLTFL
jgi:ankyrin repeat protein